MSARSLRVALLAALVSPLVASAEPPPITEFTNFAQFESMKVSPNGTYLAFTRRRDGHEDLTVLKLPDLKLAGGTWFGDLMDIELFEWASDSRLIVQPTRRFPGFTAAKVPTGEIIGIDADLKNTELLFGYAAGQQQTGTRLRVRQSMDMPAHLLATYPGDNKSVMIQTYGYGIKGAFNSAYRMDTRSGNLDRLASSPIRDGNFVTDFKKNIALVYGLDTEGRVLTYYRTPEQPDWKIAFQQTQLGQSRLAPIAPWTQDEYLAYDDSESTDGVYSFNPATGKKTLPYRRPEVDIGGASIDPSGKPWMFRIDDHYPDYWYPDPQHPLAQAHRWLRDTIKGAEISITSTTDDMTYGVVRVTAPQLPLQYLYVDIKNRKLLQQLLARPNLKPQDLAMVEPIEFKARDGLEIRGLLTVPNTPNKKKLPMIVLVHGGPHGPYDRWGFDYEAQLFASRGYAVLQINYRGSGGRGANFEAAGYGKWGLEMQDDITDGVRWAIADGVADAKRICIYGGSYGGYAALTGVFREPDLFRCAVGMAGVYDLSLMYERGDIQTVKRGVNYLRSALGDDMEDLKRRSPVYNADKIKVPVLLLHGKDDERAPIEHANRMRAALEKAGNAPEWMTEWGEGHGFFNEKNREVAYKKMLDFFARHLGT